MKSNKKATIALVSVALATASKAQGINYSLTSNPNKRGWIVSIVTGKRGRKKRIDLTTKTQALKFAETLLTLPFSKARKSHHDSIENDKGHTLLNIAIKIQYIIEVGMNKKMGMKKDQVWPQYDPRKGGVTFYMNGKRILKPLKKNEIARFYQVTKQQQQIRTNRLLTAV